MTAKLNGTVTLTFVDDSLTLTVPENTQHSIVTFACTLGRILQRFTDGDPEVGELFSDALRELIEEGTLCPYAPH